MQVTNISASGAILIGGKSHRFKSDKTFIEFTDGFLSAEIYRKFYRVFGQTFFVSNTVDKSPLPEVKVIVDLKPDIGPIGGLYTALSTASFDYCFISACDMPFLSIELIHYLWKNCTEDHDIIVPVWDSKIEPLAAFYHKRCLSAIESMITDKRFMMKGFWDQVKVNYIDMSDFLPPEGLAKLFFNINTQEDYKSARAMRNENHEDDQNL